MFQFFQQLLSRLKGEPTEQTGGKRVVPDIPDELAEAMASRMKLDAERHRNRSRED